ncbi:MAG: DUF4836 family protein [Muribaculaceae bacterium]|nr:DUF4836 family protein [Muribaculaceae bacterium]
MKRITNSLLAIATLLVILLPSCSGKESANAGDLLATVPSDASVVSVMNVKAILEKAGCKVSDDKIELSPELKALAEKQNNPGGVKELTSLCNGASGVDPTVMAAYKEGYDYYVTGYLADPDKFKAYIAEKKGGSFSTENGIDICGNVAVSNSRFWVNLQKGSIQSDEISRFTSLSKSQSFLDNGYAQKMSEFSTDIEGWGDINGLLNTADLGFQGKAWTQIAVQTLYEDPSALVFSVDFKKGAAEVNIGILNSKDKEAKFQLATEKIDLNAVASIGGKADILAAIAIPEKLISQLTKEASSKRPSMMGEYLKLFQSLDGTTALAIGAEGSRGLRGIVTTNGKDLSPLTSILGSMGINVSKEGNVLRLSEGEVSGALEVSAASNDLKGAMGGVVLSSAATNRFKKSGLDRVVVTLIPESGSLRFRIAGIAADDSENILKTIIKNQ